MSEERNASRRLLSEVRQLVVLTKRSRGALGGVELLTDGLLGTSTPRLTVRASSRDGVEALLEGGGPSVVFVQSEGSRDVALSRAIVRWIECGAVVVDQNIFALPFVGRTRGPRYIPAFMSRDGMARHVIRARSAGLVPRRQAALLPNPVLHSVVRKESRPPEREGGYGRVRLLRVGRPDIRKWSTFELDFAKSVAEKNPNTSLELRLVGSPPGLLSEGSKRLPANLRLDIQPYANDVTPLYATSDVYLHHSRIGETFGNTLFEANRSGLPVVCALDPGWDCAPLEYLSGMGTVFGAVKQLVKTPPDLHELMLSDVEPGPFVSLTEFRNTPSGWPRGESFRYRCRLSLRQCNCT